MFVAQPGSVPQQQDGSQEPSLAETWGISLRPSSSSSGVLSGLFPALRFLEATAPGKDSLSAASLCWLVNELSANTS